MSEQPLYLPSTLLQGELWPSEHNSGEVVKIAGMAQAYAFNSYHKLVRWSPKASTSPLAMALLAQAIGEEVVYAQDVPETQDVPKAAFDLEECYEINVMFADRTQAIINPITQARVMQHILAHIQDKEQT